MTRVATGPSSRACLHDQWLAERDVFPAGPGYMDYARFVAARPRIFGKAGANGESAWHLVEEARRLVLAADGPPPSRWRDTGKTTPSGKTLLKCGGCGTESPVPTDCRAQCTDERVAWGWRNR